MEPVVLFLLFVVVSGLNNLVIGGRPAVVNIGAVLTYDSFIGGVAKAAIEAAVADVNSNKSVLGGTRLNLVMENSNCSVFFGSLGAFSVLEKQAIALIGPQSSAVAHMISSISNGLQIPLISFAATDPTLSSLEFPFFLRMTHSDSYQMAAMADVIDYYGWRQVIAIFVDDDYGRNGMYYLDDELAKKMSKIYKIALPVKATRDKILDVLQKSRMIGPRVYVVHVTPDSGLEIFSAAQDLQMLTEEYVWLATDWLSTTLDTSESIGRNPLGYLQGVVGFRQYVRQSNEKDAFASRWNVLHKGGLVFNLNTYGFYAYDTVWAVALAINDFLNESGNITFSSNSKLPTSKGKMQLGKLKIFDGGSLLHKKLLSLKFTGLSGPVQFDSDNNLINSIYEIINVNGSMVHTVGYWSNYSGLSISIHESSYGNGQRNLSFNQVLGRVAWPGGKTEKPRGWVVANNEKPLRIGVPYRASYLEFVTVTNKSNMVNVSGYCIDVFKAIINIIPYDVSYQYVLFGNGRSNPNYDELVNMVAEDVIDAAIGDIAIVTNRTKVVDFTQPYISTGLVILAPIKSIKSNAWVFLRPFTVGMWCMTGAFFFLIGVVIWLLEHRLSSPIKGIDSLIASNEPIGYQVGSFAQSYLIYGLNVHQSRLVSLGSPEAYEEALRRGPQNGGVAAIVDELPYVEMFLSKRSGFGIVGQPFTRSGWGFLLHTRYKAVYF
ncbi:glutamate receptor 3.7 [Cocos nucifera]|nr:glutamate receptor 3.7 [Cocos nucifera]